MKNLLAIFLMAILFVSCDGEIGPMGPPGPPGEPGQDGGITEWWIDKNIAVKSSDWELVDNGAGKPFFIYEYRIDDKNYDLYQDAYAEGLVTCYMYLDYDDKNIQAQTALPYTLYDKDDQNNHWEEHYSAEYTIDGFIIFKVTISDFFVDQRPPEAHFKVALTY
ncbi:hypothetical protein [Parabacteroides timonensis]|uniref:hypothetical protein n=1 Tax=Parabacteroides timonensis TaxID=1871013 RepID=UPI00094EE9C5|nr:hypothetical protein [Parabacteroides timonensis]